MDFAETFQEWMLAGCLTSLLIILVAIFARKSWMLVRNAWRDNLSGRSLSAKVAVVAFLSVVYYVGATKPPASRVSYDGGIKAGTTANVIDGDTVTIYWQRDTSGGVAVPESSAVYIDYCEIGDTNRVWTLLAETTVGAWSWSGEVTNATNYNYNCWAYYIPPAPVHTNGVWTYRTMRDGLEGKYVLPLRTRIEADGKAIATPKEVRDEEGID